jgi:hypothetical protein
MKVSKIALFAACGLAAAANAQVLHNSNGFESPYVPGPLAGQQGYIAGPGIHGNVQTATFQAGAQAVSLMMDNSPATGGQWYWVDTPHTMAPGADVLNVSCDIFLTAPAGNPGAFGFDIYQGTPVFDRIVGVYVGEGAGGNTFAYVGMPSPVGVVTSATITFGSWHHVDIIVDFGGNTFTLKVDGNTVVNAVPANVLPNAGYTDTDLWALGGGGDNTIFYDNFKTEVTDGGSPCYPDCDGDTLLTLADFGCFQTAFGLGQPYADCDGDTLLTLADFGCFQTAFGLGCP